MMAIVCGAGSSHQVLAEMRHFMFRYNLSHFAAFHPQNQKVFLKFKNQVEGRKSQGRRGQSHLIRRRHINDKTDAQKIHDGNQKVK